MPARFIPCICGRKPCTRKELTKKILTKFSRLLLFKENNDRKQRNLFEKQETSDCDMGANATLVHFEVLHCQEGKDSKEETQCHSGEPGETDMPMTPGHEVNSNSWELSNDQPIPASFSVFSQSPDNPNAMSSYSSGMSPNEKCKSIERSQNS